MIFCPREMSHEVQQVELCATFRGVKVSPKYWCCTIIKVPVPTRAHVAAMYPWEMYPQHFHECALAAILSLLHVPATRPSYPGVHYTSFLLQQHVPATRPLGSAHLNMLAIGNLVIGLRVLQLSL